MKPKLELILGRDEPSITEVNCPCELMNQKCNPQCIFKKYLRKKQQLEEHQKTTSSAFEHAKAVVRVLGRRRR